MPTFDGGSSVESLDYDFSKVPDYPKKLRAKGTVKEPSDGDIGRFLEGLKDLSKEVQKLGLADSGIDLETASFDQMMAAMEAVTGDQFVEMLTHMSQLFADLCGNSPSLEQLSALPMRVRVAFFAWIMEQVVRPEGGMNGGAQVVNLPVAAATG